VKLTSAVLFAKDQPNQSSDGAFTSHVKEPGSFRPFLVIG
jgi:hypothetical protein